MIISLSGRSGNGKSTVAAHLTSNYGFVEVAWAIPIKEHIGRDLFCFSDEQLYGDKKDIVDEDWLVSPRMVFEGAGEWFKRKYGKDFWTRHGIKEIRRILNKNPLQHIVVSDTRFKHEAKLLKGLESIMIYVDKQKDDFELKDLKDELFGYPFDYIISCKEGDIMDLYTQMDKVLKNLDLKKDRYVQ